MKIIFLVIVLGVLGFLLIRKRSRINVSKNRKTHVDDLQKEIEQTLSLPHEPEPSWKNEPASVPLQRKLAEHGIKLQNLTKYQAMNVLGLFSPPDDRQVEVLKHFNIPYSYKMNQTMAYYLIRELFSDPVKLEAWNNRPPTTTVRQGLLFMHGDLANGLSHVEAQVTLDQMGMKNPQRYQEWKQVERLFLETNNPETRAKYKVRKITWKRFFESYEALKDAGIDPKVMQGKNIIEHSLRQDDSIVDHAKISDATRPAISQTTSAKQNA